MKLKQIFRLIRLPNLLLIIFIQYFVRFFIFSPALSKAGVYLSFSDFNFALLVLTTILIATGGYIINDYFDKDLDKVGGKANYVDTEITSKTILNIYIVINILALVIAFYISFIVNSYKLGFLFILIQATLWFYSQYFKKTFLIGNLIIAILAGLVPIILLPYEFFQQIITNGDFLTKTHQNLHEMVSWTIAFGIFSAIFTLIREIIKDIEDYEADNSFNYRTLPIVAGIKTAKAVIIILILILIVAFGYYIFTNLTMNINFAMIFAFIFIILPLLYIAIRIFLAKEKKDYRHLSLFSKLIMITATLFLILIF